MYSELTYLKRREKYRNLFEREYCQKEIITCHNIVVKFYARHFDHAFSRSNRRSIRKMYLTQIELIKNIMIKQVLQENNIPIYQDIIVKQKKKSDKSRRVLLTPYGYVVVIRMTGVKI